MLESILLDLGYHKMDPLSLGVVLYIVLSSQLCILVSWPRPGPTRQVSSDARGRSVFWAMLYLLIVSEIALAVYGVMTTSTGLMWDVTAVATVQAVTCFITFVTFDVCNVKNGSNIQPTLISRRRNPGGPSNRCSEHDIASRSSLKISGGFTRHYATDAPRAVGKRILNIYRYIRYLLPPAQIKQITVLYLCFLRQLYDNSLDGSIPTSSRWYSVN
ncbi:hypothetical protein PoB_002985600 [Plakobranchus ocellatus]|uniref:Uncharacterized protein n=1 Tax=Plakobranchus ocellatus TaxID=259542 RepID=A0AAV4A529_9GAST|nr:hypothetical protein PoB_002985600 [Plakobranchus ocellatus]